MTPKTILEWLGELPEGIREKAFHNAENFPLSVAPLLEENAYFLSTALASGFDWKRTPEGDSYWDEVYREVELKEKSRAVTPITESIPIPEPPKDSYTLLGEVVDTLVKHLHTDRNHPGKIMKDTLEILNSVIHLQTYFKP